MGQFADLYQQQQQQQQGVSQPIGDTTGFNATYQDEEGSIYDEDLVKDINFQRASKIAYEMNNSTEAEQQTPEDYAKWGIEHMGWFNWNLPKMTLDASRISNATDEQKRAFLYMMESYEDLGASWKGTGRFFKGILLDPTTYIGLTTFGLGAAGGAAGKQATKQGVKELLKRSTRGGVIAGVEAGVYTAADDVNRQVVETSVSGEDIDYGRVAKSGAIGVGAGFTLGTGLTALISRYGGKTAKQLAKDEVDEDKMLDGLLDEGDFDEAEKLYHGSNKDFDAFDTSAERVNNTMNVRGVYLYGEARKGSAKNFGENTYTVISKKGLKTFNRQGENKLSPEMIEQHKIELENAGYGRGGQEELDEYATSFEKWSNIDGEAKARVLKAGGYEKYVDGDEVVILDANNVKIIDKNGNPVGNKVQPESPEGRLKSTVQNVIKAVKRSVPAGKVAALGAGGVQNMQELVKAVEPIKQLLLDASTGSPDEFANHLIRQGFTGGQSEFLEVATSQTVSALKLRVFKLRQQQVELDGDEAKAIQELIDELEVVITPLDELDVAMSRVTAQTMRARRASLNTGALRGETISKLEASGLSRSDAERQWDAIFSEKLIKKERDVEMKALNEKIETARKSGDMSEFIRLRDEKRTKVAEFKEEVLREEGNALYRAFNKPVNFINKIVIGFVFSPATLIVNLVPSVAKSIYKPALNNLMSDGLTRKAYRQTMAEYSAMQANIGSAFNMAKAAWRYQRSGLTGDTARFLEDQSPIANKHGGRIFGFFPRALLATDAFFENINYRGFAVGDATGRAVEEFAQRKAQRSRKALKYNNLGTRAKHPKTASKYDTYENENDLTKYVYDGKQWVTFDSFYQKRLNENFEKGSDWTTVKVDDKELDLDQFIELRVKEATERAYAPDENAIDILEANAITRGLTGKKRENFILEELEKNEELFIKATNDDGKDYVQDLLFKRDFSGNGIASQLAKGYEQAINKHPIMRLAGQLFFRTPVRVFEEGIRMTPMLNLVSPKFMRELKGGKGVPKMRHIRAQGEAMMGYAIAGSVMSLYATGNITGSMGTNYKQTRQGENTGELEPYTIKFSDGSTFNYRNFDPFSTPIKIIVNALERAEMLAYRAEQGEHIDKSEMDKVQSWIAVAAGSVSTSIRDANLASGVDAVADLWEDLQEEDSDQLIKFFGKKAQMFLPNTYYKIQMLDDGYFGDPVTMEQFLRQRINPQDPKVPKRHSALGRVIENPNGWAGLLYFNRTTVEERKGDVPEKVFEVEKHLYKLAQVGDTHFTAPYKNDKYFGGRDLRSVYTTDGEETLYSRWMRYYYESGVIDVLHSQIGLPMGTASSVGIAEKAARKTINSFRKQAFMRLYAEEAGIQDRHMELLERRLNAKTGETSSDNIPHYIGN